jgi:hypothetical protein
MTVSQPTRRRDIVKPWLVFRDAGTGRYVSRLYALLHKDTTVSERRR